MIIFFTPLEDAQLVVTATQHGLVPEEFVRKIVLEHLSPEPPLPLRQTPIDEENSAAIHLLETWLRDEATDNPEEIRLAEADLAEFKRNLNANRAATGERLLFPE